MYNFYKKPKAQTATVTELCVLEHLKLNDEQGDAEHVLPPDPVADQGQPHWVQDFLSFVAK